jgi:hypothetical protein
MRPLDPLVMESDAMRVLMGGAAAAAVEPAVEIDRAESFPEIAWRSIFADYREAMKSTTEASDVAHFGALWAAAAATLGRRLYMFSGERIYPNVYVVQFGPTGDKKTTCQRLALNRGLIPAEVHIHRQLGSMEGLAEVLGQSNNGGDSVSLFFWEELSQLFAHARWAGSTILEFFTEAFDCPDEWGKTYKKNPINVSRPTPSILSGSTPEWFWKNADQGDFYGGFGNRLVFLTGPRKPPMPSPSEPSADLLLCVKEAFKRIGSIAPQQCVFNPQAARIWDKFYRDWDGKERLGLYGAATRRIHVFVRKLAMVYAAFEKTVPEITADQLKAAIGVGLYAAECARLLIESRNSTVRPEGEIENRVLEWVQKHDGARKRYMQQTLTKMCGSCKVFNATLNELSRSELIEIRDQCVFIRR